MSPHANFSRERAFGELRSILHEGALWPARASQLWTLLQSAAAHSPEHFEASWRGYLRRHAHLLASAPIHTCHSLEELAASVRFLPMARFTLVLQARRSLAILPSITDHDGGPLLQPVRTCDTFEEVVPLTTLARDPLLANVHTLKFVKRPSSPQAFSRLFTSPHITSLRALILDEIEFEPGELAGLLTLERPAQITSLAITRATEVSALQRAYPLPPTTSTPALIERGRLALSHDPKPLFSGLEALDLSFCDLHGADHIAQWLGGARTNATCQRLVLRGNNLTGEGLERLALSPNMAALTHLDLSYNAVSTFKKRTKNKTGSDGYGALIESPHLQHLQHLDLSHNIDIHRAEYDALTNPPANLPALERFVCEETNIREEGILRRFARKLARLR